MNDPLKRFFGRIKDKALDVSRPPVLIVALGDSVTQGCMELGRLDPAAVYHREVQTRLEAFFPTTTFGTINAGVSGGDVPRVLDRLERDALRHEPDLVFVAFGLNDSLGGREKLTSFGDGLGEIVSRIRARTEAAVMLLTPPFMATRVSGRIHPEHADCAGRIIQAQTDGTLSAYAEKIREVSREKNTLLADIHAEWERLRETGADPDQWLANGLNHPDARGHHLAATVVFHRLLSSRAATDPHVRADEPGETAQSSPQDEGAAHGLGRGPLSASSPDSCARAGENLFKTT